MDRRVVYTFTLVCWGLIQGVAIPKQPIGKEIVPLHPTFTPKKIEELTFADILEIEKNLREPMTDSYPGYKKGTKSTSDICGIPGGKDNTEDSFGSRITGGTEAEPHSYPWMAGLFMHQGSDTFFCGGTILNEEWVLTAGHCTHGFDSIDLMLGAHNVRADEEDGRIEVSAAEFFSHPNYNQIILRNDVGLVRLPQPIQFNNFTRPICMPAYSEADEHFAHLTAWASGWGKDSDSASSISPVLREVDTETITNLACALEFPTAVTAKSICISGAHGKSTCNGDSGGPLHLIADDGRFKQIGVTSFGSSFGCEIGMHAGFTRTTSFLQFIETNTGLQIEP